MDILFDMVQLGAIPPSQKQNKQNKQNVNRFGSLASNAIKTGHNQWVKWMIANDKQQWKDITTTSLALDPLVPMDAWKPYLDTSHLDLAIKPSSCCVSQQTIIDLIDHLESIEPDHKTMHYAISRGDCEIVSHLIAKGYPISKATIEHACSQGILLCALGMFYTEIVTNMRWLRDTADIYETETLMMRAQHQFYSFLQNEVTHIVSIYSPTMSEEKKEELIRRTRLLVDDFYHPSTIGAPDSDTRFRSQYVDTEDLVSAWEETNPLAAMRWRITIDGL
jgi:hypothetical protein